MNKKHFPHMIVRKNGSYYECTIGIELKSVLKGDLLIDIRSSTPNEHMASDRLNPKTQQADKEMLLQAISSWQKSTVIELNMTALPDLKNRIQGKLMIPLLIKTFSRSEESHAPISLPGIARVYSSPSSGQLAEGRCADSR